MRRGRLLAQLTEEGFRGVKASVTGLQYAEAGCSQSKCLTEHLMQPWPHHKASRATAEEKYLLECVGPISLSQLHLKELEKKKKKEQLKLKVSGRKTVINIRSEVNKTGA